MENNLQNSTKLGHPVDSSDVRYIAGLSTVLVATIQEAKDRISQIEYIFCSQLFPKFQLTSQNLEKTCSDRREATKEAYKDKESQLSDCFMELQKELTQKNMKINEGREVPENFLKFLESKESLIQSYEITIKELKEKDTMLLKNRRNLEAEVEELRLELMKKSKEVDEVMELHNKLLQINQSKVSLIVQKETKLKEYEEKANGLSFKLEDTEKKVNELLSALRKKTEEVGKGNDLQGKLLKTIEFQASEITNNEQLLNKSVKENKLLAAKVENLTNRADELQKELGKTINELEEGRNAQKQLLQQTEAFNLERIKRGQELEEFEKEREKLLDKKKVLEEKVDKLQECLNERIKESSEGMELHGKLLQQIKANDSELLSEKKKRRDVIAAYKRLKSQYHLLSKNPNLNLENILPRNKVEGESEVIRHNQSPLISSDIENNASKALGISNEGTKEEGRQEIFKDNEGVVFLQKLSSVSPSTSSILISPKCPTSVKSCPAVGAKRPISYWRDTRSHQNHLGPDLHDDFLDTPLEKVRENLGKVMEVENQDLCNPVNTNFGNSDDETQDMNIDNGPQKQQMLPPKASTSGFKYVEPVRRKSERESLMGVECKQCKKFYDAVLTDTGKNSDGNKQNTRCEHHDGVSRHRYRYAPPSTPDGFWNIGFESET